MQSMRRNRTGEDTANRCSIATHQRARLRVAKKSVVLDLCSCLRHSEACSLLNLFGVRQAGDLIASQSKHGPFMHRLRSERAIKFDRRFIPIEHSPFHSPAAAITRNLCKLYKQGATITFPALVRLHEQIFKIKSGPPEPG